MQHCCNKLFCGTVLRNMHSGSWIGTVFFAVIPPETIISTCFLAFTQTNLWNAHCNCHMNAFIMFGFCTKTRDTKAASASVLQGGVRVTLFQSCFFFPNSRNFGVFSHSKSFGADRSSSKTIPPTFPSKGSQV